MSGAPYEPSEKATTRAEGRQGKKDEPVVVPDSINYGTHTLPKKFWTKPEGSNILRDEAFRKRLAAKHARHLDNAAQRAEKHRRGGR